MIVGLREDDKTSEKQRRVLKKGVRICGGLRNVGVDIHDGIFVKDILSIIIYKVSDWISFHKIVKMNFIDWIQLKLISQAILSQRN